MNEQFLHVRARHANRTYIGATFCPGEEDARHAYESIGEANQLAFTQLRNETRMSGKVTEHGIAELTIARAEAEVLMACLATISAGRCRVLPLVSQEG